MSHCLVSKQYPYLPEDGSLVWACHPVSPPSNFQFSFTLHIFLMAVESPKTTLVVGIDIFWNCIIEKTILRNFQSPLFFIFFTLPQRWPVKCHIPPRRLIRERVTLLALMTVPELFAVKHPFHTKCQEGLFLWPTVKDWFDLQFLSQPLIFVW